MTDISLITSLYKSEKFLPTYADHVIQLSQQAVAQGITLELVIIPNDASDAERHILTQLQSTLAQQNLAAMQIHYVQRESLYASWNRGFKMANGTIFGVLNVDDKRTVDGLILAKKALINGDYDLVDFGFQIIVDDKATYHPAQFDPDIMSANGTLSPFWMCHQTLFKKAGDFNSNFRIAGDYEWSKRLSVRQSKYLISDVTAGQFLLHGGNLSSTRNPLEWVEWNVISIWHNNAKILRPVDPDLMRKVWQAWGYQGGTLSDEKAQFLWGDGAQDRYQRYLWERALPKPIRRIFLALAKRGLLHSVDWDVHHG